MDSQIFWRELYPSLNVIQPKEPQDPNNPLGFTQYLTGLTDEEKKFVARQNLLTKQQRAWNLRKQVDGKGAEKSTFFVDHEINEPTEIQRGKLSPYIPYQVKGGILKKPCKDSTNSLNPHGQDHQSQQRGSECYGRADMPTHSERTQWIGKRRYFIVDTGVSYHIIH